MTLHLKLHGDNSLMKENKGDFCVRRNVLCTSTYCQYAVEVGALRVTLQCTTEFHKSSIVSLSAVIQSN